MTVITKELHLRTQGHTDVEDVTSLVQAAVADSGLLAGIVTVFCPGSTGGLTTIEHEDGVIADLQRILDEIVRQRTPPMVVVDKLDKKQKDKIAAAAKRAGKPWNVEPPRSDFSPDPGKNNQEAGA